MRIALISDLHANALALRNVLDDLDSSGVDMLLCLGDVATLGPRPHEVIASLMDRGCPCITGNHDQFLLEPEAIGGYTEAPIIVEAVDWCRDQLTAAEKAWLATFSPSLELDMGHGVRMYACHGSPRSHMEDLLATTPAEVLDTALDGIDAQVVTAGHTHLQMLRQHRGTLLVNPGSVGLPFEAYAAGGPPKIMTWAEYAIVEARAGGIIEVALRRIPLEREALLRQTMSTDHPLRAFREQTYS